MVLLVFFFTTLRLRLLLLAALRLPLFFATLRLLLLRAALLRLALVLRATLRRPLVLLWATLRRAPPRRATLLPPPPPRRPASAVGVVAPNPTASKATTTIVFTPNIIVFIKGLHWVQVQSDDLRRSFAGLSLPAVVLRTTH
jgi:hypothetical protein